MTAQPGPSHRRSRGRIGDLASSALIVLIILKLTGVITWSWWWVLAPLWISPLAWAAAAILVCTVILLERYPQRMAFRRAMRHLPAPPPGPPDGTNFAAWIQPSGFALIPKLIVRRGKVDQAD